MQLSAWVRARLWRAANWCAELTQMRYALLAEPRSAKTIERTWELAQATEYIDPDRGRALALYLEAWRGGFAPAHDRTVELARELRAHMTIGEVALADGKFVEAACAYIDAGFVELALPPLQKVVEPGRVGGFRALLAIAQQRSIDAPKEIADAISHAHFTHAARVARVAQIDGAAVLAAARRACPQDAEIGRLVEERLLETNNATELMEHYREQFDAAPSTAEWVARVRSVASSLVTRGVQPGLGLRLLRRSLERAYGAMLPEIPSHIAAWELMATHARVQHATIDLVPLIVQALAAPLSEDDSLYLSQLGLEIAWRDANDTLAAQPYAATVLDFVPDHPLAVAFVEVVMPEALVTPEPPKAPAPIPEPAPIVMTIPPKSSAPLSIIEGQVKRAMPVHAPAAKPKQVTGRLALLQKPAAALRLKRNSNPIPNVPIKVDVPPRAPRKVLPIDVVIELPDGNFFSTVLRDVSTSGAFVVTKRDLAIGTIVALELRIPVAGSIAQANFRANAKIARRTDVGCGLAFVDPSAELVAAIRAGTE